MKLNLKETLNQIKVLLSAEEVVETSLEQLTLADGTTIFEADAFDIDQSVFIVTETENVPVPVGTYELQDGRMLRVDVEGVIAHIGEPVEDGTGPQDEIDETEEETPELTAEETELSELRISVADLTSKIEKLELDLTLSAEKLTTKETEVAELNVKLSEQPISKKLPTVTEPKTTKLTINKGGTKFSKILNHINN